jgi:hypothetical protein
MLIVKCSACGTFLKEIEPLEDPRISHSYCRQCAGELRLELARIRAKEGSDGQES